MPVDSNQRFLQDLTIDLEQTQASMASLQTENLSLQETILSLNDQNAALEQKCKNLEAESRWRLEQLLSANRARFGKKSEQWNPSGQLTFNEFEDLAKKPELDDSKQNDDSPDDQEDKSARSKPRGKRRKVPINLEKEIVRIELPPEELFDAEGNPLKIIDWVVSTQYKYVAAKIVAVETHRAVYGAEAGDYAKTTPPAPAIIPKSLATPDLLAHIAVSKYADGLPLYRIQDGFLRLGVDLGRTTMARWMIAVAQALRPVLNVLIDRWFQSFYGACDETTIQVLKENNRAATTKSWMIVRSTPFGPKKIVLFDYSVSRSQKSLENLLDGFQGYLQVDGLKSYDKISQSGGIIRLGCNMHARRRFEQAVIEGDPSGKGLGIVGVNHYRKIYRIERELRDQSPDDRYRIRNEKTRPIFEQMHQWATDQKDKVPIKSKLGMAFQYFLSEFDYLIGFLADGRLEADNGFTERAIRKFAIGRNNWMFSDTPAGADASALLYSLIVTAKVNGVNPHKALSKIISQIPLAKTVDDYERLADLLFEI